MARGHAPQRRGVIAGHPVTTPAEGGTVLFATIAAGGGHVATAHAMAEAVARSSGGTLNTRVSDSMDEYGPRWLDKRHKDSWRRLLATPRLVRAGQVMTDAVPALTRFAQDALLAGFASSVTAKLAHDPPALIVANHGWLATAFTLARRRFGLRTRVVVFATEPFDASALWSTPGAEVVLAPSAAAKSALMTVGVPEQRVLVAGYPVADRFLQPPDRSEARRSLGLADGFTCLITLGAEGVVGDDAGAALLALAASGVNLLCVTGRNAALKARLEAMFARELPGSFARELPGSAGADSPGTAGSVTVFGFVPDMERLLSAADLVVGKAGPASTMEALAVGRPVVATAYAGLNELAVTRFLASRGLGERVAGWGRLAGAVDDWRTDQAKRAAAARAAEQLDFMAMKRGLGDYLVGCAHLAREGAGGPGPRRPATVPSTADAPPSDRNARYFTDLAAELAPGAFASATRESLQGRGTGRTGARAQ